MCKASRSNKVSSCSDTILTNTTSCAAGLVAALSEDKYSVLFYNVVSQSFAFEKKLILPGQLLKWSLDGEFETLIIAHDSYITVMYNGDQKTMPIPVVQASSLVVVDHLTCLLSEIPEWTGFVCVNTTSFDVNYKSCFSSINIGGSRAFVSVKNWVYVLNSAHLHRFTEQNGCLNYTRSSPFRIGDGEAIGDHIWYSYDSSRIFLDHGLTLTASSDPQTDMQVHGDFNSSHWGYSYTWFAQSGISPYHVAGLRTDLPDTVNFYSWPYLQPIGTRPIPLPTKNATRIYGSEQVHYCLEESVLVFCIYELLDGRGVFETGIAYVTVWNCNCQYCTHKVC